MTDDASGLLLAHADDRSPALAATVPLVTTRKQAPAKLPDPDNLADYHNHPNDLGVQRWAVIAPEGPAGDALLAQVAPLIAAREAQQGAKAHRFRVPPGLNADEASRWKRTVYHASERSTKLLPRYQLILGDLDQVSYDVQVAQAVEGFVGRLAFDRPADYAAYCDKLLAAERAPRTRTRALFHSVRDGTAATDLGRKALVRPCVELARELRAGAVDDFPAEPLESGGDEPDPDEFIDLVRDPGVLLSLSHGVGAPRGGWKTPAAQRAGQGAMSFGRDAEALRGQALALAPCLPGGLWFMFACFGAGTPATSKYLKWLRVLADAGEAPGSLDAVLASLPPAGSPPFVAALPKAVLANPRGPLAFIGHHDLAWSYSFREVDLGRTLLQTARFVDVVTAAVTGDRVGVAFDKLFRWFASINTDLATLDDSDGADPLRRARMWMLRQDLAGFMLLGDPAARVVTPAPAPAAARAPVDLANFFGGMTVLPPTVETLPTIERLESAFAQLLTGTATTTRLAAELGLSAARLDELFKKYRAAGRAAIKP